MPEDQGVPPFVNRGLFREHYLRQRLPQAPFWTTDTAQLQEQLRALVEEVLPAAAGMNEATLETSLIRPILHALGFPPSHLIEKQNTEAFQPDYVLFGTAESRSAALTAHAAGGNLYERAIGIVEAKAWDVPLDSAQGRERSPMSQLKRYLVESGVQWGVLTNGREWRLVVREGSADQYFGLDLPVLVAADGDAFKYFGLLFAHQAFTTNRLSEIRSESLKYAEELEDDLRDRVREALGPLARGLLQGARLQRGDPTWRPDGSELKALFDAAMLVLYRALFALYAEARDLLPVSAQAYHRYSLRALLDEIASLVGSTREALDFQPLSATTGGFFDRARALWRLIERGEGSPGDALYIPRYDGGLFRGDLPSSRPLSAAARLLDEPGFTIPDRYLAEVLDILARIDRDGNLERVDYAELRERQLGSIYEGLLELEFRIAEQAVVAVRSGGKEVWQSQSEATSGAAVVDRVAAGEIYVSTDSDERRATGAFYTPDWVVEYLVAETVGPLFDERSRRVRARLEEARSQVGRHRRGSRACAEAEARVVSLEESVKDDLLAIRILDPAMGSGHFLVGVVEYLATRVATDASYLPSVDDQRTEVASLRRLVAERCVYGVDLSYLAVELSKLSLWLRTMVFGKPLDFLDHHLRWGNSLLGIGSLDELSQLPVSGSERPEQLGFVEQMAGEQVSRGAGNLRLVALLPSDSMAQIEQKEQVLESFHRDADGLRLLADFRVALDAGREVSRELEALWPRAEPVLAEQAELFGHAPRQRGPTRGAALTSRFYASVAHWLRNHQGQAFGQLEALLEIPRAMSRAHQFFHWPIEFPDVWFEADRDSGEAGFDAVIGNPPYVRMEGFRDIKPFLRARYTTHESRADLYVYFVERAHRLLRPGGRFGMILSNKFLRANYGGPLLTYLGEQTHVERVVDFGGSGIFGGATVRPAILTSSATPHSGLPTRYSAITRLDFEDLVEEVRAREVVIPAAQVRGPQWRLVDSTVRTFLDRMNAGGIPLEDYVPAGIAWGIKSGLNDAFYISQAECDALVRETPAATEIIRPLVVGEDIRRYHIEPSGMYLLYMYHGVDISRYPAVERHLTPFRERLERRATQQEWYELQQPQMAYRDRFEGAKIGYPEMTATSRFSLVAAGVFPNNKVFIIPSADPYILGVLNSQAMFSCLGHSVAKLESQPGTAPFLELRTQYMSGLPIRRCQDPDRRSAGESLRLINLLEAGLIEPTLQAVRELLPLHQDGSSDLGRERSAAVRELVATIGKELTDLHHERAALLRSVAEWIVFRDLPTGSAPQAFLHEGWAECAGTAGVLERFQGYRARLSRDQLAALTTELNEAFRRLDPITQRIRFLDEVAERTVQRLYGVEGMVPGPTGS